VQQAELYAALAKNKVFLPLLSALLLDGVGVGDFLLLPLQSALEAVAASSAVPATAADGVTALALHTHTAGAFRALLSTSSALVSCVRSVAGPPFGFPFSGDASQDTNRRM
jgi:hypothetical protein